MSTAIAEVLSKTDVQMIWKFKKFGDCSDDYLKPISPYIDNGRLRLVNWLNVDPASLLNTGDIVASVHHGGSNCYHETVLYVFIMKDLVKEHITNDPLRAGVPHVILPLWSDLYAFASLADDLGIGRWACRSTSPVWNAKCLSKGMLDVVGDSKSAASIRTKAKELGSTVQSREKGRDISAREISRLAYIK